MAAHWKWKLRAYYRNGEFAIETVHATDQSKNFELETFKTHYRPLEARPITKVEVYQSSSRNAPWVLIETIDLTKASVMSTSLATGTCFQTALALAESLERAGSQEVTVVHGLPIGTGPDNLGQRYWHAWAEVGDNVITESRNGRTAVISRIDFYAVGHIYRTWHYTVAQARLNVVMQGHAGPWVDGWEEMGI